MKVLIIGDRRTGKTTFADMLMELWLDMNEVKDTTRFNFEFVFAARPDGPPMTRFITAMKNPRRWVIVELNSDFREQFASVLQADGIIAHDWFEDAAALFDQVVEVSRRTATPAMGHALR